VTNRLTGWTYDSSNHLTSRPGVTYTYDNNGNTATKVDSKGTTTYAWDYENRLTSVTLPGSGGTVTFKYDPFGRRVQKVAPAGTTNYLYDGANVIEEVDATGTVLARYSQGAGVDQPLDVFTSGATKYYDADGLGSITSLADISGSLTDTYTTDTFGKTTTSTGTTRNPFRYTARDLDSETGLMYYRARYYDPLVGRFISEDPVRLIAGINFYRYVSNKPVKFIDPSGLGQKGATVGAVIGTVAGGILGAIGGAGAGATAGTLALPGGGTVIGGLGGGTKGALIGAATGAVTGAVIGNYLEDLLKARPKCERENEPCYAQYLEDTEWCGAVFTDDDQYESCMEIAWLNYHRCKNGQPRINPDPTTYPKRPRN